MGKKKYKKNRSTIINLLIVFSFFIALVFMYMTLMSYLDKEKLKVDITETQELYYRSLDDSIESKTPNITLPLEKDKVVPSKSPIPSEIEIPMQTPKPTTIASEKPKVVEKFKDLLAINIDVVGWIKIDGTTVDYPVLQDYDNYYYLKHNIYKNKTLSASIFMDYRNNVVNMTRNTIIYGHNMGNGYVFSNLEKYVDYKIRDEFVKENNIIIFNSIYEDMKFEIFSAYIEHINGFQYLQTTFKNDKEYMDYLNTINEMSLITTNVFVDTSDLILTLSTCNHWFLDSRTVIHARLISD